MSPGSPPASRAIARCSSEALRCAVGLDPASALFVVGFDGDAIGNCMAETLNGLGGQSVCHPWVPQGQQDMPICCPTGSSCCAGPPPVCCAAGLESCMSAAPAASRLQQPKCASGDPNKFCSSDDDCPGSFCPTVDALTRRAACVLYPEGLDIAREPLKPHRNRSAMGCY